MTSAAITRAQAIIDETRQGDDSNARRAARAMLTIFPSYDDDTLETALGDIMCDIRHLCDLAGFDFYEVEASARRGYAAELAATGLAVDVALCAAIQEELQ